MKILVIGGAGFTGCIVAGRLLEQSAAASAETPLFLDAGRPARQLTGDWRLIVGRCPVVVDGYRSERFAADRYPPLEHVDVTLADPSSTRQARTPYGLHSIWPRAPRQGRLDVDCKKSAPGLPTPNRGSIAFPQVGETVRRI